MRIAVSYGWWLRRTGINRQDSDSAFGEAEGGVFTVSNASVRSVSRFALWTTVDQE